MSKMFAVLTAGLAALAVVAVAPESAFSGPLDYSAGCPGGGAYDGVRCVGGKRPAPRRKPKTKAAAPAPAAEEALPASAAPAESSASSESSPSAGFGQTAPVEHKGGGVFGWLASLWAAIVGFFAGLFGH